jgi:hypothetical protein
LIRKCLVDAADAIDATDAATPCSIAASTTDKNYQSQTSKNVPY